MLKPRFFTLSLSILLVLAMASPSLAQKWQPFGPLEFETNWDIFAPAELGSLGKPADPNTGWFAAYERLHFLVTRPEAAPGQQTDSDWGWGNRYDIGYMTEKDHGWLLEIMNLGGPNNVLRDPIITGDVVIIQNSLHFESTELMKTFRLKPLHHGGIVEPFIGVRYSRFLHVDNLIRSTATTTMNGIAIENHLIGPQAGLRWFVQKGRWNLSAEGRYYYAYVHQLFATRSVAGDAIPFEPFDEQEFASAGDVRLEARFDVTKSFALTVGWDMLYFANGIGRGLPSGIYGRPTQTFGGSAETNNQNVNLTGVYFGMSFNR